MPAPHYNWHRMRPADTDAVPAELNLLREWREPAWPGPILRAGIGSIFAHLLLVTVLLSLPAVTVPPPAPPQPDLKKAVHLIAPKFYEPTQKAPNVGKVTRELDVRSTLPAPKIRAPKFRPPAPPPQPVVQASTTPPRIEPPRIELPEAALPQAPAPTPSPLPAPPPPEKPKLSFEAVAPLKPPPANPQILPPKLSVNDTVRSVILPGGNTAVEDSSDQFRKTQMQLLSDPKGVDFKPYLVQVLSVVRRNWLAVIPESARLGRTGSVLVQFIIDRRGGVPKLVIAEASGTEAFDRAAVAGISASNPFPPLPAEYKGDQIRLQLAFSYNPAAR